MLCILAEHVFLMGDDTQSYQVTSQVPAVHCYRVTHTQKCPPVTLTAVKAVEVTPVVQNYFFVRYRSFLTAVLSNFLFFENATK
jgi:hypothetical protein